MKIIFNKSNASLFLGAILCFVGVAGSLPGIYYHFSNKGSASAVSLPVVTSVSKTKLAESLIIGEPTTISIPSLNITLPVIDGTYNKSSRTWTLTKDKAQFAAATVQPNNKQGNTFIYGHALDNVFGHLKDIKTGAEADVTTSNGYIFAYKFVSTYATSPTDMSVLTYQGPPMLTVQTCSGTWYQNRQMYLFSYEGYNKL
jgi:LPXTG-site transpeptidase (sortase) family protein